MARTINPKAASDKASENKYVPAHGRDVWTVAGPIIGVVIGYYFHRGRKDSG